MTLVPFLIDCSPRPSCRACSAGRRRRAASGRRRPADLAGPQGYRLDAGIYPTTGQGLDALVRQPTLPPQPPRWRPDGYLPSLPRDPWDHAYQYTCGDGRHFTLRSLGADGAPGGDGEAADVDVDAP